MLPALAFLSKDWWSPTRIIKAILIVVILAVLGYFTYSIVSEYIERGEKVTALEGDLKQARNDNVLLTGQRDTYATQVENQATAIANVADAIAKLQGLQATEAKRTRTALDELYSLKRRETEASMRADPQQAEILLSVYNAQVSCYNEHLGQPNSKCSIGALHATP